MTSSLRKVVCMFRIKFPTKRIFRIFPILRTDGMATFGTYLWNDPRIYYKRPHISRYLRNDTVVREQESRAIAGRAARCRCRFRYVWNFTTASCGFSATARLSCIGLYQRPLKCWKLYTLRRFLLPTWLKITATAEDHGTLPESR